jgi:hypothetical protein
MLIVCVCMCVIVCVSLYVLLCVSLYVCHCMCIVCVSLYVCHCMVCVSLYVCVVCKGERERVHISTSVILYLLLYLLLYAIPGTRAAGRAGPISDRVVKPIAPRPTPAT